MNHPRVLVALLVAPLTTPFVFAAVAAVTGPRPVAAGSVFGELIAIGIYGLPIAYFAELSLGYLTWRAFLAFGIRSPFAFFLAGAAIGTAPLVAFRDPMNIPVFSLAGAVSALLFRVIAFSGRSTTQKPATHL